MTHRHDILAIGNAIVDLIAVADDDFLLRHKVHKGAMTLIDEARAEKIYAAMGPVTMASGGSAANTVVGAAALGAKTAFIGKVRDDELGRGFTHDIRAMGAHFTTAPAVEGPGTARCFVLVTPDGQRTMNTYLGACQALGVADVDESAVKGASLVYLEGYLWDPPEAKKAFRKAADIAHAAGRRVALTLSDSFCVDRYRDEFLQLIRSKTVDIVFANESELHALYQTADFETAVNLMREDATLAAVTRSEKGVLILTREESHAIPAFPVDRIVDTTGAGDLFAAGFLAGLAKDAPLAHCARLGAMAAAEIIQHIGARPETNLAAMAAENGLAL